MVKSPDNQIWNRKSNNTGSGKDYKENYYKLKNHLKKKLMGYVNIFTHNPWGEYGSEEHIQVYKVVKELQEEIRLLFRQ